VHGTTSEVAAYRAYDSRRVRVFRVTAWLLAEHFRDEWRSTSVAEYRAVTLTVIIYFRFKSLAAARAA
jgi:hypothetical protein